MKSWFAYSTIFTPAKRLKITFPHCYTIGLVRQFYGETILQNIFKYNVFSRNFDDYYSFVKSRCHYHTRELEQNFNIFGNGDHENESQVFPQSDFSSTIFSAISYICCQAHDCFKKVLHSGDFSCRRIQPWSKEDLKADTIDSLHPPPSMLLSDDISWIGKCGR